MRSQSCQLDWMNMSTPVTPTLRAAILVAALGSVLSGCGLVDPMPKLFRVTNNTEQVLVIRWKELPRAGEVAFPDSTKLVSPNSTVDDGRI